MLPRRGSQLPSELEIWPRLSPRSWGLRMGCFSPSPLTPRSGHTRVGAKQPTLCSWSTNSLEALCNLVLPDSQASWRNGIATWGHDAEVVKVGHLGWPTWGGFCGDLFKTSLDSRALISFLDPWIGVWLAVTLAACFSPRGCSMSGQKAAREANFGNVARTVSCITPARPQEQIPNSRKIDPSSYATRLAPLSA